MGFKRFIYGRLRIGPSDSWTTLFVQCLFRCSFAKITKWFGRSIHLFSRRILPSFLLIVGVLPFWEKFRSFARIRQAMLGINAAVVGILLAALYNPVWTSAIFGAKDFLLAATGFLLWLVVILVVVLSLIIL